MASLQRQAIVIANNPIREFTFLPNVYHISTYIIGNQVSFVDVHTDRGISTYLIGNQVSFVEVHTDRGTLLIN